jgi:hypothetical protein
MGYLLYIDRTCGGKDSEFMIGVGETAHNKHQFQAGIELSGCSNIRQGDGGSLQCERTQGGQGFRGRN